MPITDSQGPIGSNHSTMETIMTSTTIYTPIIPTVLYIKKHSVTGLLYFGKTTRDPYKYLGSGKYWTRHLKKHGKQFVVTLWVSEPYTDTSIVEQALHFSVENNIIESKDWANLITENGLDGSIPGSTQSDEHIAKLSAARTGLKRGPRTAEHKAKISAAKTGKKRGPFTAEHKAKMSASHTGKKRGPYSKK